MINSVVQRTKAILGYILGDDKNLQSLNDVSYSTLVSRWRGAKGIIYSASYDAVTDGTNVGITAISDSVHNPYGFSIALTHLATGGSYALAFSTSSKIAPTFSLTRMYVKVQRKTTTGSAPVGLALVQTVDNTLGSGTVGFTAVIQSEGAVSPIDAGDQFYLEIGLY